MTELERRAQLQSHVLHYDITAQQHQGFAINLLQREEHAVSRGGGAQYKHFLSEQSDQNDNNMIRILNDGNIRLIHLKDED